MPSPVSQDDLKKSAACAAMDYVEEDTIIGVGTGSTANHFIDELAKIKQNIQGAVPSSIGTEQRLRDHGIPILAPNVGDISIYVDGADEFTKHKHLIKGGGGALTREKILAAISNKFICIADNSKQVDVLGEFPLPIEVIPLARSYVARELVKMGGDPVYREDFTTDNGNHILDIYNFKIINPIELEQTLNNIPGVVTNGIFARNAADVVLVANENGVESIT